MTKIYISLFIVVLALFAQYSIGAPARELTAEDIKNILGRIAENERYQFLRQHIDLEKRLQGIQQNSHNKKEAELAIQISNYVIKNQQQTRNGKKNNSNVIANYGEQICLPAPIGCFDPNDAPIRPKINKSS